MHTIFGIVKWNSSQDAAAVHAACIKKLEQKFAAAFAGKQHFLSPTLDIAGDFEQARPENQPDAC